jgi:glycosyltransferase involved in cell wall biosynthesis
MNSENTIKFSIVIPTLNEEHYVGVLLTALCNQDFKDVEITVVDANSLDKTKEVVESFKDKLDLMFVVSPQKGVSFQRNYGAKLSKYKDLIFFDADVEPEIKFLSKIANYIQKNPADFLTSWNIPISPRLVDRLIYWVHNQIFYEASKNILPSAVGTFMYVKKEVFQVVGGFDESFSFAEDSDLARRIFNKGYKYVLLKDPKIRVSVRRFELEGRASLIIKYLKIVFLYCTVGVKGMQGKIKHEFGKF